MPAQTGGAKKIGGSAADLPRKPPFCATFRLEPAHFRGAFAPKTPISGPKESHASETLVARANIAILAFFGTLVPAALFAISGSIALAVIGKDGGGDSGSGGGSVAEPHVHHSTSSGTATAPS